KVERDFLVLSSVAGVCGVVVLVERFEVFFSGDLTGSV
ncbi:TPA: twin-arginine translocation signal domain-containing protein, partial [Klebsiella pneumoniae]|nr:twin-arginine translocation signal domain-containing protein [Klebsiella pneumoniae]